MGGQKDFPGPTVGKFHFTNSKLWEQLFATNSIGKIKFQKPGVLGPLPPLSEALCTNVIFQNTPNLNYLLVNPALSQNFPIKTYTAFCASLPSEITSVLTSCSR